MTLTRGRKLLYTVVLFVLAVAAVALASATHRGTFLFLAWVPLLAVAWVLTRAEPGMEPPAGGPPATELPAEPES